MIDIQRIERSEDITTALNSDNGIIFKHSTRCPVSAEAKRQVEGFAETGDDSVSMYMVDVIANRGLSDEIEERTGVIHHSPQVIFIHNGQITGTVTHWRINVESLSQGIDGMLEK